MSGKLIVFEGTDGSGKSTQFRRLCERLEGEGRSFRRLVFPRYGEPSSSLITMYLEGDFGPRPSDVNAYAASAFYAVDRYASWKLDWGEWYASGGLVLSDRYTTSNAVHQACKLPETGWDDYFRWLSDFEYDKLGLPEPALVIYLDMPVERSVENLRRRESATRTRGDIHEVDSSYLALCARTARRAAGVLGWRRVSCVDAAGRVRSVEDIHDEVWSIAHCHL